MRAIGQVKNEVIGQAEGFSLVRSPDASGNQARATQTRAEEEESRLLRKPGKQTWPGEEVAQAGHTAGPALESSTGDSQTQHLMITTTMPPPQPQLPQITGYLLCTRS